MSAGGGAIILPVDPPDPAAEVAAFNVAFDEFVGSRAAPWIACRIGEGVDAIFHTDQGNDANAQFDVPAGAPPLPRLDVAFADGEQEDQVNATTWYIPRFALLPQTGVEDPGFQFAVTQKAGEVTPQGRPVNQATLTLTLAGLAPGPGKTMSPAPDLHPIVTLSVPVTEGGTVVPHTVTGTVTDQPDDQRLVTFSLPEDLVEATYEHLTDLGGASLSVTVNYNGLQLVRGFEPDTGFPHGPTFNGFEFTVFGDGQNAASVPASIGWFRFIPVSVMFPVTSPPEPLPLGLQFYTDSYRSRFTITTKDGVTRPIIDQNDLTGFATARSEFRELTSLGDVQSRFPTVRRLYLGQITGTVVALPAAYAIVHGAEGVAAACDALVDPSSNLTGSRFHFTFMLAPAVDPIDLADLAAALPTIPEATGRTLRLTLPDGLDTRNPSSLSGFPAATATFSDGLAPHTVQVSVDIADDHTTPALTSVNQFLSELCAAGPPPLSANLAVRLDDQFPEPVQAPGPLNLHRSAESDDLTVSVTPGSPPTATNRGPLDLVLHRAAALPQLAVTSLGDQILGAGQTVTLPVAAATSVVVARSLAVPATIPKETVRTLVTFRTETVQQVQHPLTVQAAFDFAAAGVTSVEVAFRLTGLPALTIPDLTLTAAHTVDFVHVLIPVDSVLTGLDTAVTLNLTGPGGTRSVTVHNDFIDDPILTLTATTLAGATS
ncbi:MAG TPA: hypothetical protein VFB06_28410 [Streptosporangiaceae bacterium]|nr:hypothetical protein [Streptosporangiaceae bacterium]